MKLTGQYLETDYLNAQLLHLKPGKFDRIMYYVLFIIMILDVILGLYFLYLYVIGEYHAELGSILPIFILPVGLPLFWLLFRYVLLPYQTRKIFAQQKELQPPFEMEFTDDNLVLSYEFGNAIRPWKNFIKWKENEKLLLLYLSDIMFVMIPKRFLTDPQQLEMIKSYIVKNGIRAV